MTAAGHSIAISPATTTRTRAPSKFSISQSPSLSLEWSMCQVNLIYRQATRSGLSNYYCYFLEQFGLLEMC